MASARVERKVKQVVTNRRVRSGVVLSLSNEEAIFLRSLLRNVAGDPRSSARRHSELISDALGIADVPWVRQQLTGGLNCVAGSLEAIAEKAEELEEQ